MPNKRPIYLDYAATTPIAPKVIKAMQSCMGIKNDFGNPHSNTHVYGFNAASIVEKSRHTFASIIHAYPSEIIYTSGATESNNLALQGAAQFYKNKGKHIISVKTEHKSVLDTLQFLEQQGFEISYLNVDRQGMIDLKALKALIRKDTILASIMMVNNETGALHPIKEIAKILHAHNVLLHVDGAQALGKVPINVKELNIDLMSFSAHKIYGPKGIGALYVRTDIKLQPLTYGGGQEQGLRAGTLSPFLIAGFTRATELIHHDLIKEIKRIFILKKIFWDGIKTRGNVELNSAFNISVPHICNITLKDIDSESFLLNIANKLAIAQGSACNSAHMEPSHVLRAMGLAVLDADNSFRFSFGRNTHKSDIKKTLTILNKLLHK